MTFGAAEDTSALFDAGEWVAIADMMAFAPELDDLPADEARESAAVALASLDEALKFVPAGHAQVPDRAFWTVEGRAFRDRAPERFRRADLEARRAALAEGK